MDAAAEPQVVPVQAHAFSSTFRLRAVAQALEGARLPGGAPTVALVGDDLVAVLPDGTVALVFDFGALVFFGGAPALREALVAAVRTATGDEARTRTEELIVEARPGARPEVTFDRVVVPAITPAVRQVVGLLVAQSAAMDYYEEDVEAILARTESITRQLGESGRIRGRVRDLTRFIGRCIQTKNEVVETLALFDKPEVTWEDEAVDKLFVRLREMLEIDDRFRALEYRLRAIQDSLVLLVELSRGASTFRLELMVVLLILFELAVMVWQTLRAPGH